MKRIIIFLLTLSTFLTYAQNDDFKEGVIINENGEEITCYIQDSKWLEHPDKVYYKLTLEGDLKEANVLNTRGVVIENVIKLVRATIAVDMSSDNLASLDDNKQPIWKTKTVFLKTLVEGEANLLSLFIEGRRRYFFNLRDEPIEQLVYKRYKSSSTTINENNYYKQRLLALLQCDELKNNNFSGLKYSASSLSRLFVKYNNCKGNLINDYNALRYEKGRLKVKARVGANFSEMSITSKQTSSLNANFDNKTDLHLGAEFELQLPFKKSKNWSLVFAPNYRNYEDTTTIETSSSNSPTQDVTIDYSSIQIPIGIRHYFNLTKDFNLFIEGAYYLDWTTNLSIKYTVSGDKSDTNTISSSVGAGLGINYKRFDVMAVIRTSRNPFNISFDADFKEMSVILAYQIF